MIDLEAIEAAAKEVSTVIRWTASGRYTYAALKTDVGWYTTAQALPEQYQRVPQVVTFVELLDILGKRETSNVVFAMGESWIDAEI